MAFTNDRLTLWVISGIIGSIVRELFDLIVIWMGLPILHISSLAVDLFTNNMAQTKSFLGIVTGTITDWIMGAIFGVVIGLVLQWSGRRNYLLKGIGVGLISWVTIFGFLVQGMPRIFMYKPTLLNTLIAIVPHSIYASVAAFCIVKFTRVPSH